MVEKFKLRQSEKLKIFRRRNNLSQAKLAEQLGVSRTIVQQIENGERQVLSLPEVEPTDLEKAWILRIRSKLSQEDLANLIGTDRVSIIAMEKGKKVYTKLLDYWRIA